MGKGESRERCGTWDPTLIRWSWLKRVRSCAIQQFFFFFSSRRRHTRCSRDWSSDVCSSDLEIYLTSMVLEETSQTLLRVIAEEVTLHLKKTRRNGSTETSLKNYICVIDSG